MFIDRTATQFRRINFRELPEGVSPRATAIAALDEAIKACLAQGKDPVMVEFHVFVAKPELDFDSDKPLVCDPTRPDAETCEACQ